VGAPEDRQVETRLQEAAGDGVHLAVATDSSAIESYREHEFRLGRTALGRVMSRLGDRSDPHRVRFPHPALSLSHSAGTAVAVGVRAAGATGLGVDLELPRKVDVRAARFFLAAGEAERFGVDHAGADPDLVQQLWTIKEAVFKADLDNDGLLLRDYRICELNHPDRSRSSAVVTEGLARRGAARFRFRSIRLPELVLSIALPEGTSP